MYNKIILAGRISWIGELKSLDGGSDVINFQMATDESYKDRDGNKVEDSEFHTVTVWNGSAKSFADYKKVGDPVLVEGRMRYDRVEDSTGKLLGYWPKIKNARVKFLPSGGGQASGNFGVPDPQNPSAPATEADDDIPF